MILILVLILLSFGYHFSTLGTLEVVPSTGGFMDSELGGLNVLSTNGAGFEIS